MRTWVRGGSVVALFVALAPRAFACPTCRDALARADARWAHGFSLSVAFLLGALVLILGTFSFAVWRSIRS